ncbi:MAG: ATP-binding cassette domain-containing protein, partial [Gaiellaceae bacterium]
ELLDRVGLGDRAEARPPELSGGEQQRLAVCAALAHRPAVLLADEPTGELDAANAAQVYRLLGELSREHGCTTVIVSHDPGSTAIADRIVRIRDGRVSEEFVREEDESDTIVVGRGGWLRLPEELLARAGIDTRATARLEAGGIVVGPARGAPTPEAKTSAPAPEIERRREGPVVELRNVTKRYGRAAAVAGVTGVFEASRLHAVTGPSGSGKTTLLHLLAGLELPSGGEITVLGTVLSRLDRADRARFRREQIAFVAQQPRLLPFLSSRENVELALALRGTPADEAARLALEALEAVGLGERAEQRVARLSTGEQARVAVARALAAHPALLLADEPTSRLDQANAIALGALFSRLVSERGTTIVCATHDPVVIEQADDELRLA